MLEESNKRRRPGRPSRDADLRDAILGHAEIVFAERGYAGTKMREIAANAGVNQALIRYYFDDKESLFDEVFRRRGSMLSGNRHVLLDKVLEEAKQPTVAALVKAYLQPQWDMKYSNKNGASFVRLQARLHAEPKEHALRLRREVYDASLRRYIDALQVAIPGIPRDLLSIRMAFLVGTYMFMLNDLGRISDMTEGKVSSLDKEAMLESLVAFLSAGLCAPVS